MASALQSRLAAIFDDGPQTDVMAGSASWPGGSFGALMEEVRSVVMHTTAGWPTAEKAQAFVKRYIESASPRGGGTQYFVPGNGAVYGLIDMPRVTWHASHVNTWAIGIESGNLSKGCQPPTSNWQSLGPDADKHADDVPGMKLWLRRHRGELSVSWWTTRTYAGPRRGALGNHLYMLFSEQQYRGLAMLTRYLCEQHELPRNFPLLPHALRGNTIDNSESFRRIALADERFSMLVGALADVRIPTIPNSNGRPVVPHSQESDFEAANAATLQARYLTAVTQSPKQQNHCWTKLFDVYRGVHGHGFSGANRKSDHDCPGPVFDWHRLAREVWDWWWYPFDLSEDLAVPLTAIRPERRATGTTPLREYYFEAPDFEAKDLAYHFLTLGNAVRSSPGIFGATSSPSTFFLDSAAVPIYAPANGELVAARFPDTGDEVSMAFLLVRHEIFHLPDTLTIDVDGGASLPAKPGRIDYDQEPSYVYSLVMHLARPDGFSFTEVTDSNPDWLNRVLIRKKECDLVLDVYDDSANHGNVAQALWDVRPAGAPQRPTSLEAWRADAAGLRLFLDRLSAGDVAAGATGRDAQTPVRVLLGDFLGHGGVIRKEGATAMHGIRLEAFSSGFVPPAFQSLSSVAGWSLPADMPLDPPPAVHYQSEWSRVPTADERQRLQGMGVNPDLVNWWGDASLVTRRHPMLPGHAQLAADGYAFHFRPLQFMRWLNEATWASEWPKYKVTDAAGVPVPMAPDHLRPRTRNV
jgi:N-acetylmuramoyl-L-alanine amidase